MKGKTEITAEAFLRRKRIHEDEDMEAKDRKKGKRKTWETKTCREGKRMGKKTWRKIKQNKELEEEKNTALWSRVLMVSDFGQICICCFLTLPSLPHLPASPCMLHVVRADKEQPWDAGGTFLDSQFLPDRIYWIYTYWILLVIPLCSTHALSPLPSHLFSQNLGDCVISCCAAPPPGLAAISKQVIKGGLTNSRRPWQMDQLYKPYFLRHPGWKEDKPWGTGIMLRSKGKERG